MADLLAKQWKAALPDDASTWAGQDEDLRKRLDSGNWNAAIDVWSPRFDDPLAFLSAFTSGNPVSGTNWSNPTYDALIKAAYDVQGFVAAPDPALKDVAAIQGLVAAAKPGDGASLEALRRGSSPRPRRSCSPRPSWCPCGPRRGAPAWSRRTCGACRSSARPRATSST